MSHQDWKPVIFNKKFNNVKRKPGPGKSQTIKIEESESVKVKYFPKELSRKIIDYRNKVGMTRKQLAQKLNMKDSYMGTIESGKAVYSGAMVGRFKKLINNHQKNLEREKKKKEKEDKDKEKE
tara:strand:- start:462 stop:830 length:369 start_codon:yes stop_codon:yes gene_type:complete